MHTMTLSSALLGLAVLTAACGGAASTPTSSTALPSTPPQRSPPTPVTLYTLSGVVSEVTSTGVVPLGGSKVLEVDSRQTHS
jgi:ABC-type glycerol-3-phosphate transport system substrate-binding protein